MIFKCKQPSGLFFVGPTDCSHPYSPQNWFNHFKLAGETSLCSVSGIICISFWADRLGWQNESPVGPLCYTRLLVFIIKVIVKVFYFICAMETAKRRPSGWLHTHTGSGADWPSGIQGILYARWAVKYWGCLGGFGALKYTKHRPLCDSPNRRSEGILGTFWGKIPGSNCGLSLPLHWLYGSTSSQCIKLTMDTLWACRSAIFTDFSTFTLPICTFTKVTFWAISPHLWLESFKHVNESLPGRCWSVNPPNQIYWGRQWGRWRPITTQGQKV